MTPILPVRQRPMNRTDSHVAGLDTKQNQSGRMTLEWLGLQQITGYASISEKTLRAWIHTPVNPLPAVRVRGKILVKRSELDAWLQGHHIRPVASVDVDAIVKNVLQSKIRGR